MSVDSYGSGLFLPQPELEYMVPKFCTNRPFVLFVELGMKRGRLLITSYLIPSYLLIYKGGETPKNLTKS